MEMRKTIAEIDCADLLFCYKMFKLLANAGVLSKQVLRQCLVANHFDDFADFNWSALCDCGIS